MKVTQIVELSKSRSKVYIDQEFAFVLYKGEFHLYGLREGENITEEVYRIIMDEVLPKRAKLRAMNLLKSRTYTAAQLQAKLRQGLYPESVIEQALEYVAAFHYIDDVQYAVDYITYHEQDRSRRRIEQDLQKKGISADGVERAWNIWQQQGGEQDEQAQIQRLLAKKHFEPQHADDREMQRICAFLLRKGYSMEEIRKAVRIDNRY